MARLPARLRPVGDYAPEGRVYSSERGRTGFSRVEYDVSEFLSRRSNDIGELFEGLKYEL